LLLGTTRLVDILEEQDATAALLERTLEGRAVALAARDGDERPAAVERAGREMPMSASPPVMRTERAVLGTRATSNGQSVLRESRESGGHIWSTALA
jgi:hypothetical protein